MFATQGRVALTCLLATIDSLVTILIEATGVDDNVVRSRTVYLKSIRRMDEYAYIHV